MLGNLEYSQFIKVVVDRTGLDLSQYKRESVEECLETVTQKNGIKDTVELLVKMRREPKFVEEFLDAMTVNFTTLFRGQATWKYLKNNLIKMKTNPLSIWHIGCSSGEEVVSMSIVLREIGMTASILGTDFDEKSIQTARNGEYSGLLWTSFNNGFKKYNPLGNMAQYFHLTDDYINISDRLKEGVQYRREDILKGGSQERRDIVFCRNILIYFKEETKEQILDKIHSILKDDGWLILGSLDGLLIDPKDTRFKLVDPAAKVYSKRS